MFQTITSSEIELFKHNPQKVILNVELVSGEAIAPLTEKDISKFRIERSSVSSNQIEIGSARAFELTFTIDNSDGKFDNVSFDGAKIFGYIFVEDDTGTEHRLPFGKFTIDGHENDGGMLYITALDRMVWFDKEAHINEITLPISITSLLEFACYKCNIDYSRLDFTGLSNTEYIVEKINLEESTSWRTIVQWCLEILGACSFMDEDGYFSVGWYKQANYEITPADRFSHKIFENNSVIAGITIVKTDDTEVSFGEDGLRFLIEDNPLITDEKANEVAENLAERLIGFTYRPFEATTLSMPFLFPLDGIYYTFPNGTNIPIIITNLEYTLNDNTEIKGVGESEATSGYATIDPLTKQQRNIIAKFNKQTKKEIEAEIADRIQSTIRLNEIISNAFGLFQIPVEQEDGSIKYFFSNTPTLAKHSTVYTFNAGGFAWTTDYNGSQTVWQSGITADGNAVLNYLTVHKLTADHLNVQNIGESIQTTFEIGFDTIKSSITTLLGNVSTLQQTATEISISVSTLTTNLENNYYDKDTIDGKLELKISTDDNNKIVSMLNASADVITITSNRISIASDYFTLTQDGKITATGGDIGGFKISNNALTNENGGSSISVIKDGYETCFAGNTIYCRKDYDSTSQQWAGVYLQPNAIHLSCKNNSAYYGISFAPNHKIVDYSRQNRNNSIIKTINGQGISNLSVNNNTFASKVGYVSGTYNFYYFSNGWRIGSVSGSQVNLNEYGISVSTTYSAVGGFTINLTCTSYYDYNKTEYGGNMESYSQNGSFVIGSYRERNPSQLVMQPVVDRGAFIKFVDYKTAYLCYDSHIGGNWYLYDTFTGNRTQLN